MYIYIYSCAESSKEQNTEEPKESPPAKKRKASPIVFDVGRKEKEAVKKDKEPVRERTVSASSDSHVILSTTSSSHKYDALPPCKLFYYTKEIETAKKVRAVTVIGFRIVCDDF